MFHKLFENNDNKRYPEGIYINSPLLPNSFVHYAEVKDTIQKLIQKGTEDPETQRVLDIISREMCIPIPELYDNFHIDGKLIQFKSIYGPQIQVFDKANLALPRDSQLVIVETHPDDGLLYAGGLLNDILQKQAIASNSLSSEIVVEIMTKDEPCPKKINKNKPILITAMPDELGVTDDYLDNPAPLYAPYLKKLQENGKQGLALKRAVRDMESHSVAYTLGLSENHFRLGLQFGLEQPAINNGQLELKNSLFANPTKAQQLQVDDFVKKHKGTHYLMSFPFSNHPHHRIVTQMFMKAIFKYNPTAIIHFWQNNNEVRQHDLTSNTFYFPDQNAVKNNCAILANLYSSQNHRYDERSNYSNVYQRVTQAAFGTYLREFRRRGLIPQAYTQKAAERFLSVQLTAKQKALSEDLSSKMPGSFSSFNYLNIFSGNNDQAVLPEKDILEIPKEWKPDPIYWNYFNKTHAWRNQYISNKGQSDTFGIHVDYGANMLLPKEVQQLVARHYALIKPLLANYAIPINQDLFSVGLGALGKALNDQLIYGLEDLWLNQEPISIAVVGPFVGKAVIYYALVPEGDPFYFRNLRLDIKNMFNLQLSFTKAMDIGVGWFNVAYFERAVPLQVWQSWDKLFSKVNKQPIARFYPSQLGPMKADWVSKMYDYHSPSVRDTTNNIG